MKRHLLLVVVAVVLVAAACGDDSSSDETSTADTEAPTETTADSTSSDTPDYGGGDEDSTTETTAAPASADATVALAEVGAIGEALVGPDGRTLYLFEQDDGATSACTGGCVDAWPALVADGGAPTGGDGVDASLLSTADGQVPNQVVYNGHLLYYFAGDEAPGDANGLGIPSWYPVDAAGNAIDAT